MPEKLLQYIWNYKIFTDFDFRDVEGNSVEILDFGTWNHDAGPDFINAKIRTKNLVLAGNIELHLKSSDWVFHNHSSDPAFGNVVLHAVYLHDTEVEDLQKRNIPTIELKNYINEKTLWKYEQFLAEKQFVPCEKIFSKDKVPFNFCEESVLKKLDLKSTEIEERLCQNKNNYEAVLFQNLAYAFGLKVNAQIFKQIAERIDFGVIQKIRQNQTQLEALLFGISGWLENPIDDQMKIWKREFEFLKTKYRIPDITIPPKFLRLRPPNFPTLRLSQLANLYFREQNLFSKIIQAKNIDDLYSIFSGIKASEYWGNHYNFGKNSASVTEKKLTKPFIDIIIINAVLPIKYTYHKHFSEEAVEDVLRFYEHIPAEKNTITDSWQKLGVEMKSSLESQAYIFHHKAFCEPKKCLNCGIGFSILKEVYQHERTKNHLRNQA